tara:strand:+ start:1098 stop:1478 length:381 start_codon:yes stop_codon:yes gene_type:complete
MGHYAKVEDGVVTQVIVAQKDFIDEWHNDETWLKTSYNTRGNVHYAPNSDEPDGGTAIRGNFAEVGGVYDKVNDVFYNQKPFESWTLDTSSWLWVAPIQYPNSATGYKWNESAYQTDNTKGWESVV